MVFGLFSPAMGQDAERSTLGVFMDQHCTQCHGAKDPEGDLNLIALEDQGLDQNREQWLLVAEELSLQVMPPHPEPKPSRAEYRSVLALLREALGPEVPSLLEPLAQMRFLALRRRTTREITGAIFALTGVKTTPGALPAEAGLHVYDVVGAGTTLDGAWLDRWLTLTDSVSRQAVRLPEPERVPHAQAHGPTLKSPRGSGGRLSTQGNATMTHKFPRDGEYILRGTAWAQQAGPEHARVALTLDGKRIQEMELTGEGPGAAITMTMRMRVSKGPHRVGVAFLNDYYAPEEKDPQQRDRNVIVKLVSVEGPTDLLPPTEFQTALLRQAGSKDDPKAQLKTALTLLAERVWQEGPRPEDIDRLLTLVQGEPSTEARMQLGLAAVLASPRFLLVGEAGDPGAQLSGSALATRLALFLWGSLPDARLLELGRNGTLQETKVLSGEVDRMLADDRSKGLAAGFVPQWLQLVRLQSHEPNRELYPAYDDKLRAAMLREPVELFQGVLQENLPARDLVRAEWTRIDRRLARHYGLSTKGRGKGTERYSLIDTPRRGVLGHGAVLTASSDPGRTSPVLRGKWVLEALLGDAPPPPSANTLALDQSAPEEAGLTMRERLALHRSEPGCATCHVAMDPLGFALERFDAIGQIRQGEVDDQGTLPDGTELDGPLGLTQVLEKDIRFLPHLTRSLATYAIGRPLGEDDLATLLQSMGEHGQEDPPLGLVIRTIVLSDLFRLQPEV